MKSQEKNITTEHTEKKFFKFKNSVNNLEGTEGRG